MARQQNICQALTKRRGPPRSAAPRHLPWRNLNDLELMEPGWRVKAAEAQQGVIGLRQLGVLREVLEVGEAVDQELVVDQALDAVVSHADDRRVALARRELEAVLERALPDVLAVHVLEAAVVGVAHRPTERRRVLEQVDLDGALG